MFSLVNQNDIDLVLFKWYLMLFQKINHSFDLVDEDFNLWGEFFVIRDNFHDFSEQNLVFGVIVGVNKNSFPGVCVEVLKIGQDNLDLVQKEISVDIDPSLDFDFQ